MDELSSLAVGFYTVPEAARLIRVGSSRRIYGWLRGYPDRQIGPLLTRDFEPIGDAEELSFLDLMEVRFVEFFRENGVKMASLRRASSHLRSEFDTKHPFASQKVLVRADKTDLYIVEIFRKSAEETDDVRLRSLTSGNYVMGEIIQQSILPGVEFDSSTHLVNAWIPMPEEFPQISVNPRRAFGQPIIQSGIPTGTLFDAWKAERNNADAVADWFNISSREVIDAVRFEQALDAHAQKSEAA